MLRITPTEAPNAIGLMLEGKLQGPWVEVLRETWKETLGRDGRGQVRVDLGGVRFVDAEGRELLRRMHAHGARLTKASAFLREMLKLEGTNLDNQNSSEKGE